MHFLLGDLDDALREQIVDAFQDLRVGPGTEIMKAGESADFFYVIVSILCQGPSKISCS